MLVLSLGLHWALLQSVAWTGMLIRFSAQGSFMDAVAMTFDGEHPCSLCKVVTQGRAGEKQQAQRLAKSDSKLDCGLIWQQTDLLFAVVQEQASSLDICGLSRQEEPPKPRPRGFFENSRARA